MSSIAKTASGLKTLALHELENHKSNYVWVVNKTNPRGNLNLTVADGMGNQVNVRIPITWIPLDLTTQATKNSLMSSPQFRTLIAKGVIGLIDPDAAQEFLRQPEAQAEMRKVYDVGMIAEVGQSGESNADLQAVQAESSGDINPFVLNITMQTDMSEEDVLRELRNRSDELSKMDFQYVAQNSKHEKVKSWAAEQAL